MKRKGLFIALVVIGCVILPARSPAPVVIKKDEGMSYQAPGEEPPVPDAKDAQEQFDAALAKEKAGSLGAAIGGYRKTVRRFPKSNVASNAQYRMGTLMEKQGDYTGATKAYEKLIKDYPRSGDFNNAIEGVFRIGNSWLDGKRQRLLGIPTLPSMEKAIDAYAIIIKNAPYSRFAPLAQFNVGQARERQSDLTAAIKAYQIVVDKYATNPAAADALYQIGFCYMQISQSGSNDRVAAQRARENFEDYLASYPNSEKAAQAKDNLNKLASQQTGGSLQIARYYDKQKLYRAAIVYYNDVIRQQPNSPASEQAKQRLDALRAKLGDAAFNQNSNLPTGAPAVGANGAPPNGAAPKKPVDDRLQAQTDTASRPDYVGPPVSAPTPKPTPEPASVGMFGGPPPPSSGDSNRPETTPPPVPEGEQPTLPSQ